ncbi:MAG: TatD family hydrolase [Clostridia bacterium]|nr:TatD family hydrolase [Clostridia bacterium]MBQ7107335.1 TatD family hydrolase [Clostridia bacterium]
MIFDSHAHYDDTRFDNSRDELLLEISQNGVCGIINCGTDIDTSAFSVSLAEKYDFVYAAVGYHPESVNDKTVFDERQMRNLINNKRTVAIGEIGLDYYWDTTFKQKQIEMFEKQLIFANEHSLPVIIHDREAHGDTLELIKKHKPKGVLHCFSGSVEMAKEAVNLGLYIGFGGVLTFKNSKKAVEVAEAIPLESILLETDAPYLAPEPNRGKLNRSDYIEFVAKKLADIKNIDYDEVLNQTLKNTKKLFNI